MSPAVRDNLSRLEKKARGAIIYRERYNCCKNDEGSLRQ